MPAAIEAHFPTPPIMLISFSVSNFRSFGEEVTLNMVASNRLQEHPRHGVPIGDTGKSVLRSAVIYGANAAGKSNLIRAMKFAQSLIGNPPSRGARLVREPFRFQRRFDHEPTGFEFRFLIEDRVYFYGFDLMGDGIQSEWLGFLHGDSEVDIYARDDAGQTAVAENLQRHFESDDRLAMTLKNLALNPMRPQQLFLSRVSELPNDSQGATLQSVVAWLTESVVVLNTETAFPKILERLQAEPAFRQFAQSFLENAGTGVQGLEVDEQESDANPELVRLLSQSRAAFRLGARRSLEADMRLKPDDSNRVLFRQLMSMHTAQGGSYTLPFGEESDGTRHLLGLLPVLDGSANAARVFVIDELDRSLHPLLCWEFIRFFSESCPARRHQLIVTTHEAHLLNQDLLRRDEYWFVEKDETQQSRLTSLSDFKIRNDLQLQKGYLLGRFGAIPMIGSLDPLQELLQCGEDRGADDATPEATA